MKKIIITIDGHSACGKSTLARQLAEKLKYGYIDTGAMYRAVTYYFLENRVNVQKTREVDIALDKIDIHFKNTVGGNRTFLNGADVEDAIRKMFVSKSVSHVAAMSKVRRKVVKQQQEMGNQKGIVMEGRDIGTVVFPKAELKIFLTADEEVRTQRRHKELQADGQNISAKAVKNNLKDRDRLDSTRKDSPLKQAKEAILIDNTNLTQKEQLAMVLALANERIAVINKIIRTPLQKRTNATPSNVSPRSNASNQKPTPNRANTTTEKRQTQNSSNNKNTQRPIRQSTRPSTARTKPADQKTKPVRQSTRPNTARTKPADQKAKPVRQSTRPNTARTKPANQKAKPVRQSTKSNTTKAKPANQKAKPVQRKSASQKEKSKATAPKKAVAKKPPSKTTKQQPKPTSRKKHTPRKPKQNTKKKDSIEDLLDDFSF